MVHKGLRGQERDATVCVDRHIRDQAGKVAIGLFIFSLR
jgi:hypothetical protein